MIDDLNEEDWVEIETKMEKSGRLINNPSNPKSMAVTGKKRISKWEVFNYITLLIIGVGVVWIALNGGVQKEMVYLIDYNTLQLEYLGDLDDAQRILNERLNIINQQINQQIIEEKMRLNEPTITEETEDAINILEEKMMGVGDEMENVA